MDSLQQQHLLNAYLESLSQKERQAYDIAKHHLGTTFNLRRSNGFVEYMKKLEIGKPK